MIDVIKVSLYICIYYIPVLIQFFFHFFCSLFCISFRAESIRIIQKVCFKDRFYHYLTGLLHNPVFDSRYPQWPLHATGFTLCYGLLFCTCFSQAYLASTQSVTQKHWRLATRLTGDYLDQTFTGKLITACRTHDFHPLELAHARQTKKPDAERTGLFCQYHMKIVSLS